jgi:hypothetical protein
VLVVIIAARDGAKRKLAEGSKGDSIEIVGHSALRLVHLVVSNRQTSADFTCCREIENYQTFQTEPRELTEVINDGAGSDTSSLQYLDLKPVRSRPQGAVSDVSLDNAGVGSV